MGKDKDTDPKSKRLTVEITVLPLSEGFVAATELGGVSVRSPFVDKPDEAVRQLFTRIVNNHDDSGLGLALALEGTSLSQAVSDAAPALPDGG